MVPPPWIVLRLLELVLFPKFVLHKILVILSLFATNSTFEATGFTHYIFQVVRVIVGARVREGDPRAELVRILLDTELVAERRGAAWVSMDEA